MFVSDPNVLDFTDSQADHEDFLDKVDQRYRVWQQRVVNIIPNVIPGYNDSIRAQGQPRYLPRDVDFFEDYWDIAHSYLEPARSWNMVMITSFNEWHEGTQIEPADEYGLDYLRIVGENSSLRGN